MVIDLTPLSKWLVQSPNQVVAVRSGEEILTPEFVDRVQHWICALDQQQGKRWAVYHSEGLDFLAILFALWQLGRTACVFGDNRPGTVTQLAKGIDGFVGEFPSRESVIGKPATKISRIWHWFIPDPDFVAIEIFTSGSTGDPKSIPKTIAQLEREIETLESLWPSEAGSVVLTTVSHQHLFGMIFALFWPFSSNRAFESKLCEFPEDIIHRAKLYSRFSLISSPSHLARFNPSLDWESISSSCVHVVSSSAPLAKEDSIAVGKLLDTQVREIYGSSESGAVAWRVQQDILIDAWWVAIPPIYLESTEAGTLSVKSPYLGEQGQLVIPDRVEFNAQGCFKLIGRVDRVVKVEGKRVSLDSIEGLLLDHSWVKNVHALTVERIRIETAIVIQLNQAGIMQLQETDLKSLIAEFKEILSEHYEAVVLPRRWRFVEEMPFNQQGKLPLSSLQALFDKRECKWPQVVAKQLIDGKLILQCYIPAQLIYFDGHMPHMPILPGITQLHWAEAFGRKWLPVRGRFGRLEAIKFQQVIRPGYMVSLRLDFNRESKKLSFRYESKKGVHSSGRICFE